MNERVKFIAAYLEAEEPFAALCERFGVSRKTGYKWLGRYEAGGVEALGDRSSAPLTHPHAIGDEVVQEILAVRRRYPRWGPRKVLVVLERQRPELELPNASTVARILRRHGLVGKKKRIRRSAPYGERLGGYEKPNAVWCADFKGPFPVAGQRCSPLTITDGFSRYLLRCDALKHPVYGHVKPAFERTFREYGLPDAIRTDNGPPFSTLAPAGLSRLAVWWIRLGIRPERIQPGRPDQNGRHERMHSTLKAETCKPPRSSFCTQQRAFDRFQHQFNEIRPHEALGQRTPASLYTPSVRPFPDRLPQIQYPAHFKVEKAYPNGYISFRGIQWRISSTLTGELIGLEEIGEDRWKVFYGPILIGLLDIRTAKHNYSRSFGLLVRTDGEIDGRRRRRRRFYRS